MKYIAPAVINQQTALTAILGVKGNMGIDHLQPTNPRSSSAAYESDE